MNAPTPKAAWRRILLALLDAPGATIPELVARTELPTGTVSAYVSMALLNSGGSLLQRGESTGQLWPHYQRSDVLQARTFWSLVNTAKAGRLEPYPVPPDA